MGSPLIGAPNIRGYDKIATFNEHNVHNVGQQISLMMTNHPQMGVVRVMLSIFTPRRYASAVYAVVVCQCICLSDPLYVTSRYSTKWLHVGPRKPRAIDQRLWFSDTKDLDEIRLSSPQRGQQIQVTYVKFGDFRPIFCHISETVQDRDI